MNETDIARRYIEIGFWSLLLAVLVMAIAAITGGFAYSYWTAEGFTPPTLAFTLGALIALGLLVVVALAIGLAMRTLREHSLHRQNIELMEAEALLRERQPAARVAALPAPPIITTGVELEADLVGGFIDKRDVQWFARWIAEGGSWSESTWLGKHLPFGYSMGSHETYDRVIQLFVQHGILVDRDGSKRKSGRLAVTDFSEILKRLGID